MENRPPHKRTTEDKVDPVWRSEFAGRMRRFETTQPRSDSALSVSIKVRVSSGCFHREHSPRAYSLIDSHLRSIKTTDEFAFEEHESGPEVLAWITLGTAGVLLAKSVIELITAIIKARNEGIKKGDHPSEPLELIVRRTADRDVYSQEVLLRIRPTDDITEEQIKGLLTESMPKLIGEHKTKKPEKKARAVKKSQR